MKNIFSLIAIYAIGAFGGVAWTDYQRTQALQPAVAKGDAVIQSLKAREVDATAYASSRFAGHVMSRETVSMPMATVDDLKKNDPESLLVVKSVAVESPTSMKVTGESWVWKRGAQ